MLTGGTALSANRPLIQLGMFCSGSPEDSPNAHLAIWDTGKVNQFAVALRRMHVRLLSTGSAVYAPPCLVKVFGPISRDSVLQIWRGPSVAALPPPEGFKGIVVRVLV